MTDSRRGMGDEREEQAKQALPERPTFETPVEGEPVTELVTELATELEPGWRAARSLLQLRSDELLAIMLRPSFRPARDVDLVPVMPCTYCGDGGLRTAGSVRSRRGRELVRACDTCGAVAIGESQPQGK